jgi:CheY-like chemotaxis protein/anti-sigma regulatory factor (Ser/Thr protein kinase)
MTRPRRTNPAPLAALSHEFRTPLNGVLGMARLLEGTKLTAEQKSYVAALKQSGDHLLSLVNDVLDLAKLGAGALTLTLAPTTVDHLLQTVCELMSPRAHDKGLEIAWATSAGLPPILADEGRLKQILFNLAGNAVKYTTTGGLLLTAEMNGRAEHGPIIRFEVRDTGPGIPAARQKTIFQPFAHGADADAARSDSAGLGLAIVRRLADAQGGKVGVQSHPGDGSTCWFEAAFEAAGKAVRLRPLRGLTVAIASPSAILREAASRQIRAAGGRAIACLTLAEAAERSPPHTVILVDQALAKRAPLKPVDDRPCLILLPPEARSRIARARKTGFAGYLIKPLRATSLAERVLAARSGVTRQPAQGRDERAQDAAAPGARVLLVEDNPINALLARKLLEREGCSVDQAGAAHAAMLAAVSSRYDLILMDRRLPDLDGLTATRRLRDMGVTCPIVALTADAFEEDRRACLAAGMDDFLTKPLDPNALRAILARAQQGQFNAWTPGWKDAKLAS